MADPTMSHDGGVLGVKFAALVAGFAGGVASLSFVRGLTKTQAVISVLTGTMTSAYMAPVLIHFAGFSSPELQHGASFFIGLTSMNIIPGLLRLSELFKRDPRGFFFGNGGDK